MSTALIDSPNPWIETDLLSNSLEIVLLKRTLVLSWSQFIYAEGSDDEVRVVFASHDVVVRGAGLLALLASISAQRVISVREPTRPERFAGVAERFIREINVRRNDVD